LEYIIKNAFEFEKLRLLYPYFKGHKGIIAGGVFKDIFLDKNFRDIDVFFWKETEFLNCIHEYNSAKEFSKKYENDNAIGYEESNSNIRIDFVRKRFGSPKEIIDSFDFSVSKFALYKDEDDSLKVIYHPLFFQDLVSKSLRFDSSTSDPISQFSRVLKYSRYGFKITREDQITLIRDINQMDEHLIDSLLLDNYDEYY
jgi:hypothetical protein